MYMYIYLHSYASLSPSPALWPFYGLFRPFTCVAPGSSRINPELITLLRDVPLKFVETSMFSLMHILASKKGPSSPRLSTVQTNRS